MILYYDVQQGSDEWLALRLGRFTASTFGDLFAAPTTAAYEKAILRVVYERLTGESPETFTTEYMQRGNILEEEARKTYEIEKLVKVDNGGFFEFNEYIGGSPDGLIGEDGSLEIKCPAYNTMINYLLSNKLPRTYYYQVHGQMLVSGRKWVDFYAYHPKLKPVTVRVERDEAVITEIKHKLDEGFFKVKEMLKKLQP